MNNEAKNSARSEELPFLKPAKEKASLQGCPINFSLIPELGASFDPVKEAKARLNLGFPFCFDILSELLDDMPAFSSSRNFSS